MGRPGPLEPRVVHIHHGDSLAVLKASESRHDSVGMRDATRPTGVSTMTNVHLTDVPDCARLRPREAGDHQADAHPTPLHGDEHVLIAHRDRLRTDVWRNALTYLGYHVEVANSGSAALQALSASTSRFDVVVTDEMMPWTSGRRLVSKIWEVRPRQRVIMFGDGPVGPAEDDARTRGFFMHLPAPTTVAALTEAIRNMLDGESRCRAETATAPT